ncbi:MAG TPA: hypothetical protein VD833_00295 [Vicinamibacterales bacterium]|nr:hypothetical protein [Vicinamibacterales bacterium]
MATPAIPTDSPELTRLQQRALVVGLAGLGAGAIGAAVDLEQFYRSWLIGFLFCLGLALGSLGLLMLQHLSGGQWGLVSRRVFEAASRTLPLVALFFIPVLLGISSLFEWSHTDLVANDTVLRQKAPYLNTGFFIVRAVIYFGFWITAAHLLTTWSAGQDRGTTAITRADSVRFRTVSAPGLLLLVLTVTFASVDWIMSLDPHWYSTIFGLLTVAGQGLSALALAIAVLSLLVAVPPLAGTLTARHFHDLGKLMLAFVMLWAYLAFSQFLIIWSGNLPEEIPWYIERMRGVWGFFSILLLLGHFALPFLLLLSRDLKRHSGLLARVAIFVILMRLIDLVWLVAPNFEHHGFPLHWMDLVLPIGLIGLWLFMFARNLRSQALLPLNDPYFKEAFAHEAH